MEGWGAWNDRNIIGGLAHLSINSKVIGRQQHLLPNREARRAWVGECNSNKVRIEPKTLRAESALMAQVRPERSGSQITESTDQRVQQSARVLITESATECP